MKIFKSKWLATFLLGSLAVKSGLVLASEADQLTALGMTNAGLAGTSIALPLDAMAATDNPAGMAFVGDRIDNYLVFVHGSGDNQFGGQKNQFQTTANVPAPGLGINYNINSRWTLGLSVWGLGVQANYHRPLLDIPGAGISKGSFLQVNFAPTVTYKIMPNLSVGASVIAGIQQLRDDGSFNVGPDGSLTPMQSHGTSYAGGVGGSFGVLWAPIDKISLGASYFSPMRFSKLSGYSHDLLAGQGGWIGGPARYGIGASVKPVEQLTVAIDLQRIMWREANTFGDPLAFGWRNQNVLRFGVAYDVNSKWTVQAGYSDGGEIMDSNHTVQNFGSYIVSTKAVTAGVVYNFSKANKLTLAAEYDIPATLVGTGPSTGTNIHCRFETFRIGFGHAF